MTMDETNEGAFGSEGYDDVLRAAEIARGEADDTLAQMRRLARRGLGKLAEVVDRLDADGDDDLRRQAG